MVTANLIQYLNKLEVSGVISQSANNKIQDFLDYNTKSLARIFLIITGCLAVSFISAGIFSIIAHNWDDFPKHVRGTLSVIPSVVALYFYYLATFKHKGSILWSELTSLFLALMIGASIALVSQTYNLNSDLMNFFKVWLILILPLLYLDKASAFVIVYLGLTLPFLQPQISFFGGQMITVENSIYFWIFFLAYIPHLIMHTNLKSSKQGFRAIYLGWLTVIVLIVSFVFAFRGGHLLWAPTLLLGFYLFGKKYFSGNASFMARPYQTAVLFATFLILLNLTSRFISEFIVEVDNLRNIDNWSFDVHFYYWTGLLSLIAVSIYAFKRKSQEPTWNRLIVYLPVLMVFIIVLHYLEDFNIIDLRWLGRLVLNIYILAMSIHALTKGANSRSIAYMLYGLFLAASLMWMRYFDMEISFWLKGLIFMGVGGVFFLVMSIAKDDLETE